MSSHILRGIFLLIFLVALGVAYLWFFDPGAVNSFEQKVKESYLSFHEKPFLEAAEKLDSGDTASGFRMMEAHLDDLDWVKKTDQLSAHKRRIYERLIGEYLDAGDHASALRLYDSLLEFDDRDLGNAFDRAALLLNVPARRAEGEAAIAQIFHLAPTPPIARKFLSISLEKRDLAGASRALYFQSREAAVSTSSGKGRWQVYWNAGEGFSKQRTWQGAPSVLDDGTLVLSVELPTEDAELIGFRIDPPRNLFGGMRDVSTFFRSGDRRVVVDSKVVDYALRRIEVRCGALFTQGKDPFMYFAMPENLSLAEVVEVEFVARLEPGVPRLVADLVGDSVAVEEALQVLSNAGDPGPYDYLVALLDQRDLMSSDCSQQ